MYNPWGMLPNELYAGIDTGSVIIEPQAAWAFGVGTVIQIDQELMLVTGPYSNGYVQVQRGYDHTQIASHQAGAYISLCLLNNSSVKTIGLNFANGMSDGAFVYGIWWEPVADLSEFRDLENTSVPSYSAANDEGPAAAPPASPGNSPMTVMPQAAIDHSTAADMGRTWSAMAGNLLGMPFAQMTTPNPPQWEPAQAAAGPNPMNRLAVLDAAFAAGDATDQDQSMGLDGGNRSNDATDAWFAPDDLASWDVKSANWVSVQA
jgi:hypothetical protein